VVTGHERQPKWAFVAAGLALLFAVGLASFFAGRGIGQSRGPHDVTLKPLTFRSQPIFRALFAFDGRTVVFSAAPEGNKPELFTLAPDYPEPRPLGVPDAQLLSVSSKGELALLTHARFIAWRLFTGTLARMPLGGGAPREVLEGVREADWSPDGEALAIIREVNGKDRLEYPIGKVLYETGGYLSDLRFSPAGDRIALFEHPFRWDDRGDVMVVDLKGKRTSLAEGNAAEQGLAWSPDGREVLFSATLGHSYYDVYAVTLAGRSRVALPSIGGLTLFDTSRATGVGSLAAKTSGSGSWPWLREPRPSGNSPGSTCRWPELYPQTAGRFSSPSKTALSETTMPSVFERPTDRRSCAWERALPAIFRRTAGGL
jgi:hypothetical protein